MSTTNQFVKPRRQKLPAVKTYTGSTAVIDKDAGDIIVLARSGATIAATLADPTANTDDGRVLWIKNGEAQANTLTITNGLGGSGSSYDVLTFAAAVAANCTLRAYQGSWYLVGQYGVTVA